MRPVVAADEGRSQWPARPSRMGMKNGMVAAVALGQLAWAQGEWRGIAADEPDVGFAAGYARRHGLVVGIDEYDDQGDSDLGYAAADAQAVASGW